VLADFVDFPLFLVILIVGIMLVLFFLRP